ncbi:unnamed protein product [Meganyctiphanes norvegica]|uniref:MSP domain-containing protein n=1 Tax=Meganyctiphanes norvegica TaxID=48144 RepID=A0AAV2Q0Y5_MEGNR
MQVGGLDGRLPVFVFPPSLTFFLDDATTHKQIVTVYNPYDFPISYQVLCNAPNRYTVDFPHGMIRAKCSLDVIVRHTDICLSNVLATDKLRIQISEEGRKQVLGRKDVLVTLLKGGPEKHSANNSDRFESVQPAVLQQGQQGPGTTAQQQQPFLQGGRGGPSLVLVGAAVVCLVGLLLPTEGDASSSRLPPYLHLNANIKIVIAYILGLLTYAILRAG